MTLLAHRRPLVLGLELDGCGDGEECREVARPLPLVIVDKLRAAGLGALVAPTDHEGLQPVLDLGAGIEERRSLGRAEPFVTGSGVEIRTDGWQMEGDVAWRVGTVHDAQHPSGTGAVADRFHRKRESSGTGDVTKKNYFRPIGDTLPEGLHPGVGICDGQRDGLTHIPCASLTAEEAPGAIHGAVLVIRGEDLVHRAQWQTAGHHVDGGCGIGEIHHFVGCDSQIGRQLRPGVHQQCGSLPPEKGHRLPLQGPLPSLVRLEDRERARTKRAMLEEDDIWVKQKECVESRHGCVLQRSAVRGEPWTHYTTLGMPAVLWSTKIQWSQTSKNDLPIAEYRRNQALFARLCRGVDE